MTTRWMIAGCRGQLGFALERQLAASSGDVVVSAVDLPEVDVSDPDAVVRLFDALDPPPDVVMNAAAFTHVDRCEREPESAHRANAVAPELLARAAKGVGARFVHVSTDYVFPGDSARPYTEADATGPRSAYGRTKLEGEERVRAVSEDALVVRTSWVFGRGRNFPAAILAQAEMRRRGEVDGPLRVVNDQHGSPTYSEDLADGIRGLVATGAGGLVHVSGGGVCTWWDLARACLELGGYADLEVEPIATDSLDLAAPRPAYSVLDCTRARTMGVELRPWREALAAFLRSPESPLAAGATA